MTEPPDLHLFAQLLAAQAQTLSAEMGLNIAQSVQGVALFTAAIAMTASPRDPNALLTVMTAQARLVIAATGAGHGVAGTA